MRRMYSAPDPVRRHSDGALYRHEGYQARWVSECGAVQGRLSPTPYHPDFDRAAATWRTRTEEVRLAHEGGCLACQELAAERAAAQHPTAATPVASDDPFTNLVRAINSDAQDSRWAWAAIYD